MNPNKPDADKAAEEKYENLLETVKIALSYRDFGVLNEYLKSIGEEKTASSQSGNERSCPCLYLDEPCHERCTCVNGVSSAGCFYCATYGSIEQRKETAKRIADWIKKGMSAGKERAALAFLVKVKEHKDNIGKDEWYDKNQPLAWEQARQALSTDVSGEQNELKNIEKIICSNCAEEFKSEIDLEAHLFNNKHCNP